MFTVEYKRTYSSQLNERLGHAPDQHMAIVYKPEFRPDGTSWPKVQYVVESKSKKTVDRYVRDFLASVEE